METTGRITRAIIQDIRTQGSPGLDAFVRHFGPKLLVFVNYKLGDRLRTKVEAEDVLQDFFAGIIENREGFLDKIDDRGVHRTVFRMLENRIKDLYEHFFKTQKRDGHLEVRESSGRHGRSAFSFSHVAGSSNNISKQIEAIDEYQSLEKILAGLDESHRKLFVFKFVEELTNQEMASELGVSVSTVKRMSAELVQTIQRARKGAS
jgi:RNA polymerase sigma factor (sigma-70 family)